MLTASLARSSTATACPFLTVQIIVVKKAIVQFWMRGIKKLPAMFEDARVRFVLEAVNFYKSLSLDHALDHIHYQSNTPGTGLGGQGELTSQIGTFTYASPEQIDGGEYNSSTDMFSLGVILFEMCHLPFSTGMERMVTISNAHGEGVYGTYWESLSKSNPGISTLLNQLLSTTPSKRPSAAIVVETCEMLKSQISNTAADSKQNELEAENKRLKALVANIVAIIMTMEVMYIKA